MAKLVAKTYADAIFMLAVEEGRVDELYSEVCELLRILKDNPELSEVMRHPGVDKNEKIAAIRNIFTGRVSAEVCGLLNQIVVNNRYEETDGILAKFIEEVKEYKKTGVAYVSTPVALSDAQKDNIRRKLLDTTDYVEMEMNYEIDPSLIGGMRIRIGDRVIDSSISTKLNELARQLRRIQLNKI
ncbi:MAG: ATP synthase F1 subunit delta [Lachnospiraceae bacterium]|nr:ATP synthase F1 subunit delta [Lachnospiraceae bacterium]